MIRSGANAGERLLRGEYILREYLAELYELEDGDLVTLIKSYLSCDEQRSLKWHATVVTGKKALILTDDIDTLEKIYVIERGGRFELFLKKKRLFYH